MANQTPMVKQYSQIKAKHQDSILFFRLGDFYEMFNEDALVASKVLEITLTGRGGGDSRMPMCGIPYHSADSYISKLILKGFKVAICEQVEEASEKAANSVVKREVVKIITPGTVIEPGMLNQRLSNWLAAISFLKDSIGFAVVDASTGEFRATQISDFDSLKNEIDRINPSELLIPDIIPDKFKYLNDFLELQNISTTNFKDIFDYDVASDNLKNHFQITSLDSFGVSNFPASLGAAAAILEYLKNTQKASLCHINKLSAYSIGEFMYLDNTTYKNLEIVETIRDKSFQGSLLWVLDQTKTAMGSRMLRKWILEPLLNIDEIKERLEAVEEIFASSSVRMELESELKEVSDIERLTGRISVGSANARDLISLKQTLERLPGIKNKINRSKSKLIQNVCQLKDLNEVIEKINCSILEDPPISLAGGGIIKDGYNSELDDLKQISRGGKEWLAKLENEQRMKTGIKSLKVGYTKVFGYYIEITKSNLSQVPLDYTRKQTLVNAERFITPELKERETMILNADERLAELEHSIFCSVRDFVAGFVKDLQIIAKTLSCLDVLYSLASVALENNYCKPLFRKDSIGVSIKGGRHPVVEKTLGSFSFVPNDIIMNQENRFLLITGPNMAGKSTYMRQTALISLMAQIGSFVPASSAEMCIVDRIFTRIGAMDDIFSGQSTFMLEMTETANILNNATERSLIILDEIGRGTSTFDGMSIAAAVAEYIHNKIKAKTLFATHYHEISRLAESNKGMVNYNISVIEENDHITFLHKIVPGPADKSYGIQVARLAGLPKSVIDRAKGVYNTLEMVENSLDSSKGDELWQKKS